MTTVTAELEVQEFVRFFEAGDTFTAPTNGKTVQELAELTGKRSIVVALQTFRTIKGAVTLEGREEAVPVDSGEFDHSPKYYIDAQVVPIAEVPDGERLLSKVPHPQFGVKTRFDYWELEQEKPEVVTSADLSA